VFGPWTLVIDILPEVFGPWMKHAEERKETGLEKPRSLLEACEILGNCKNFQVTSKEILFYVEVETSRQ
jgi:hypothetical protein